MSFTYKRGMNFSNVRVNDLAIQQLIYDNIARGIRSMSVVNTNMPRGAGQAIEKLSPAKKVKLRQYGHSLARNGIYLQGVLPFVARIMQLAPALLKQKSSGRRIRDFIRNVSELVLTPKLGESRNELRLLRALHNMGIRRENETHLPRHTPMTGGQFNALLQMVLSFLSMIPTGHTTTNTDLMDQFIMGVVRPAALHDGGQKLMMDVLLRLAAMAALAPANNRRQVIQTQLPLDIQALLLFAAPSDQDRMRRNVRAPFLSPRSSSMRRPNRRN